MIQAHDFSIFCEVCDAVSVSVHSEWEAIERYGWMEEGGKFVCPECQKEQHHGIG